MMININYMMILIIERVENSSIFALHFLLFLCKGKLKKNLEFIKFL